MGRRRVGEALLAAYMLRRGGGKISAQRGALGSAHRPA